MPHKASRETKPKTKKKTRISVRGRLSVYFDPSASEPRKEKTLHFIGVGRLRDSKELSKKEKKGTGRPKPAVCENCGRVWKATNGQKRAILRTCLECKVKRKIASKIKIHVAP